MEALITNFESPPDMLCLSKTWFHEADDINCFKFTGYNTIHCKKRRKGGGVSVQGYDIIKLIEEYPNEFAVNFLFDVKIFHERFLILVVYKRILL